MSDPKRTTKYVTLTVKAVFHGDYLDADEVTGYLQGWIESGPDDRDDLYRWGFGEVEVTEIGGDPEGFDAPSPSWTDEYPVCVADDGQQYQAHDYCEMGCRRCGVEQHG